MPWIDKSNNGWTGWVYEHGLPDCHTTVTVEWEDGLWLIFPSDSEGTCINDLGVFEYNLPPAAFAAAEAMLARLLQPFQPNIDQLLITALRATLQAALQSVLCDPVAEQAITDLETALQERAEDTI